MKQRTKDTVLTGTAIFTQLFGASNLIFPPTLGAEAGSLWFVSYLGFMITVFIALFAIYVLNKRGGYVQFGEKIGKTFMRVFMFIILIPILAILVLPRTSAVAYEAGFQPYFSIHPLWFYTIYFIFAALLALKETKVNSNVAKLLGPLMMISILCVIVIGIFTINPTFVTPTQSVSSIFTKGLSAGYQTADGLAAFIQGGLTLAILRAQGYNSQEQGSIFIRGGIIFTVLIGLFYLGLFYLGAIASSQITDFSSSTQLLYKTVLFIIGPSGSMLFSVIIILTCFTTNIGIFGMISSYFFREYKINYALGVIILAIGGIFLSLLGVDLILFISLPLFKLVCPTLVVLLFCNYFKVQSAKVVKIVTYSAIIITLLHILYTDFKLQAFSVFDQWPLAQEGLIWVLPSIVIATICSIIVRKSKYLK